MPQGKASQLFDKPIRSDMTILQMCLAGHKVAGPDPDPWPALRPSHLAAACTCTSRSSIWLDSNRWSVLMQARRWRSRRMAGMSMSERG